MMTPGSEMRTGREFQPGEVRARGREGCVAAQLLSYAHRHGRNSADPRKCEDEIINGLFDASACDGERGGGSAARFRLHDLNWHNQYRICTGTIFATGTIRQSILNTIINPYNLCYI